MHLMVYNSCLWSDFAGLPQYAKASFYASSYVHVAELEDNNILEDNRFSMLPSLFALR